MDFKKIVRDEMGDKYLSMLDGIEPSPYSEEPQIYSTKEYEWKRESYFIRLEKEKNEFNNAIEEVIQNRADRIFREEKRKRAIRKTCLIAFLTVIYILPILFGVIGAVNLQKDNYTGWLLIFLILPSVAMLIGSIVFMKERKGFAIGLLVFAVVLNTIVFACNTGRYGHTDEGFFVKYGLSGNIICDGGNSKESSLIIKEEDNVKEIRAGSFADNKYLKKLEINGGVEIICSDAFKDCKSLETVIINSKATIDNNAFSGCKSLKTVVLNGGAVISSDAFSGCASIESIEITNGAVRKGAFKNVTSLEYVAIYGNATVESYVFSGCMSIKEVILGENVTLSSYIFGEKNLSNMKIYCKAENRPSYWNSYWWSGSSQAIAYWNYKDKGITAYGLEWVRTNDNEISISGYSGEETEIYIPDKINGAYVTRIGYKAFYGNDFIKKIVLSENLHSIGDYAFADCAILTTISLPKDLNSIGEFAFLDCNRLEAIVIYKGVKTIGRYAFSGCSNLVIMCEVGARQSNWSSYWVSAYDYYGTTPKEVIYNCIGQGVNEDGYAYRLYTDGTASIIGYTGVGGNVKIPTEIGVYKVTKIASKAFQNNQNIVKVIIPNSVESIGSYAFDSCFNLREAVISKSVNTVGEWVFRYINSLQIKCEAASKPRNWDRYWNIKDGSLATFPVEWGYRITEDE